MPLLQILPLGALIIGHIAPGPLHQVVLHTPPLGLVGGDQHVGRDEEGSVLGKVSVGGIVLEKITRNQSIKYNYLNFFFISAFKRVSRRLTPFLSRRHHIVCLVPDSGGEGINYR